MEFRIKFVAIADEKEIGLKGIDRIREEAGCQLPLERITGTTPKRVLWGITVPEGIARRSGKFEDSSVFEVELKDPRNNRWWYLAPVVKRNPVTGEVLSAHMEWWFDDRLFLFDWENAGFSSEM